MAVDSPTCIKEPGWLEPQYYARTCSAHTSSIQESSLGPDWDKVRDVGRRLLRPKVIVAVGGSLTFFAMRIFSQPLQIQRLAWRTWKNAHIVTSQEVRVQSPKFQEILNEIGQADWVFHDKTFQNLRSLSGDLQKRWSFTRPCLQSVWISFWTTKGNIFGERMWSCLSNRGPRGTSCISSLASIKARTCHVKFGMRWGAGYHGWLGNKIE